MADLYETHFPIKIKNDKDSAMSKSVVAGNKKDLKIENSRSLQNCTVFDNHIKGRKGRVGYINYDRLVIKIHIFGDFSLSSVMVAY